MFYFLKNIKGIAEDEEVGSLNEIEYTRSDELRFSPFGHQALETHTFPVYHIK